MKKFIFLLTLLGLFFCGHLRAQEVDDSNEPMADDGNAALTAEGERIEVLTPPDAANPNPPALPPLPSPAPDTLPQGSPVPAMQADAQGNNAPAQGFPRPNTPPNGVQEQPFAGLGNFDRSKLEDTVGNIVLVDETPTQVLSLVEQLTGKIIIPMQNLPASRINLNTRGNVTRAEAIIALKSALSMNGIALTPISGRFVKAIPQAIAMTQAPELITGSTLGMAGSQEVYVKMFKLKFLSADEARLLIERVISMPTLVMFPKNNSVMITDSLVNLQRVEALLVESDSKPEAVEPIFIKLQKVTAAEIKTRMTVLQQSQLSRTLGTTAFDADERSNQLIVVTHPENEALIRKIVESLDVDVDTLTTSSIFDVNYADAEELVAVINQIIDSNRTAAQANQMTAQQSAMRQQQLQMAAAAQQNQQVRQQMMNQIQQQQANTIMPNSAVAFQFSSYAKIVPDKRTNKILVYGTKSDIDNVKLLIDGLDALLPQVRIEVVIAEVTLGKDLTTGLSAFGMNFNRDGDGNVGGNEISGTATGMGSTNLAAPFDIAGTLRDFSLSFISRIAKQNSNIRLLSSPNITTTHNQEATFNVSESRPIVTGTTTDTTNITNRSSSVQYRDIGIQLTLTPKIGVNGMIQMDIKQTVERVVGNTIIDGNPQPIIGKREAESFVSVEDNGVIILAGLRQVEQSKIRGSLALLGDIPLLGYFFGGSSTEEVERELVIFIRPYVIMNPMAAKEDHKKFLEKTKTKEISESFERGEKTPELVVEKPGA